VNAAQSLDDVFRQRQRDDLRATAELRGPPAT
jgi:hypothetical protein